MAIDTHVHLDAGAFAADRAAVIERARAAGVERMLTIGTDLASSRAALALAVQHPFIWASAGLHPHEADECPVDLEDQLAALAACPRVVAIGETGLDFYRNLSPPDAQRSAFRRQIAVAQACNLPIVIHSRDAHDEVIATLEDAGARRVVMHCFTGDEALARRCLDNGWFLAFGGAVTYPRNAALRAVMAATPADRLLLETDAPYLAPVPRRGKRNEPAFLALTLRCCAAVRGAEPAALAESVDRTAVVAFPRLAGHFTEEA